MPASPPTSADRWRATSELIGPHRARFGLLGLVLALSSALPLIGPLLLGSAVDTAIDSPGAEATPILALGLAYVVIGLVSQAAAVGVAALATSTAWTATNELRVRLTRHVLGLGHGFHREHSAGELIQRIDGDVTALTDLLSRVVTSLVGGALTLVGTVVVLTVIDPVLGLAMALYALIATLVIARRRDRVVAEAAGELGATAQVLGGIEERLRAAPDLRANGAGPHALARLEQDSAALVAATVTRERASIAVWRTIHLALAAGVVLTLAGGAVLVGRDMISVGTAFVAVQYTQLLRRPLEELTDHLPLLQQANGGMQRILDLLDARPEITDTGTTSPPRGPLSVALNRVSLAYDENSPVLHEVELHLAAGTSLGVVGRTGGGKTTLSRLVLRLIEASEGTVSLGGVPIADIAHHELRRRVALVPQEVQLVAATVADNVTLFAPTPPEQVAEVLTRVGLERLADDLDRPLGAAGQGLSAGEAQLLALARVWLRDPDLVVLDEATARVDPLTEARIQAATGELLAGRTAIVIAHRLSTLDQLDEIAVVEEGRIVEHGSRTALLADPTSRFAQLWAASAIP